MEYLKPQTPLMYGGKGIYPPTTADQVILANGERLEKDGKINVPGGGGGVVPDTRTINGKPLSEDIELSADDVAAVPRTRTINGKPLDEDIELTAQDLELFPVGSVYASSQEVEPGKIFGGVWERIESPKLLKYVSMGSTLTKVDDAYTLPGDFPISYDNVVTITMPASTAVQRFALKISPTSQVKNRFQIAGIKSSAIVFETSASMGCTVSGYVEATDGLYRWKRVE